jgi:protein-S-isoprenylcysteine O-methyltransferase Ste14
MDTQSMETCLFPNRGFVLAGYFVLICIFKWHIPSPFFLWGFVWIFLGWSIRLWASCSISPHSNSSTIEAPKLAYQGLYSYVRHPLYLGNILIGFGIYWTAFSHWEFYPIVVLFIFHHILLILSENNYLARSLGKTYADYKKQTPFWFFPRYNSKHILIHHQEHVLNTFPKRKVIYNFARTQGIHITKTLLSLVILYFLSSGITY